METFKTTNNINHDAIISLLKRTSLPEENPTDLDPLLNYIGYAKYVFLGENSHGKHEYYTWRAKISQRLIQEKGFSFVGIEGDWPDCFRLNRFAKGYLNSSKDILNILT